MKVTRLGPPRAVLSSGFGNSYSVVPGGGSAGQVLSYGSNGGVWGENVARITANGSNTLLSPYVNFVSGANIVLSVSSNTMTIDATSGGSVSFGSNSNQVSYANAPGVSSLATRADHVHLGVTSVSHTSNTYSGPVILTPGTNVAITSPTAGTFAIHSTGGSGGSGGSTVIVKDEGGVLSTDATTLDFVGSGVTASGTGATKTITIPGATSGGFYLDGLSLAATEGDEFTGTSLNARWTGQGAFDAEAVEYAVGGTWIQWGLRDNTAATIFQAAPSKETYEIIAAYSQHGATEGIVGVGIVSSTGTGVYVGPRFGTSLLELSNATAYAHASAGTTLAIGGGNAAMEYMRGPKMWTSLRLVQTALLGDMFMARFSEDGFTWGRDLAYIPTTFTDAKIGFGRFFGGASGDVIAIDRFNVLDALDQGNNLCITPTSGTATASASSSYSGSFTADKAADGNNGTEWSASDGAADFAGAGLFWKMTWSVGQTLNRVVFKERGGNVFGVAHIELYDGSTTTKVAVHGYIAGSSLWHVVDFPTLTGITTMTIVSDGGPGANCGFNEVEAYYRS